MICSSIRFVRTRVCVFVQETSGSTPGSGTSTPAPFPVSSHIGTGGLSRQGSLRKSSGGGGTSSSAGVGAAPAADLAPPSASAATAASATPAASAASAAPAPPSSPSSERRPSSSMVRQSSSSPCPSTPPGSNGSSAQGSPARYKMLPNKKLVATRSSPQLVLNQVSTLIILWHLRWYLYVHKNQSWY